MIFIYDPVTTTKHIIPYGDLLKTYQQYPGWKVYESFTNNPEVYAWVQKRIKNEAKNPHTID